MRIEVGTSYPDSRYMLTTSSSVGVILPPSIAIRTPSHIDVLIDQVAAGFDPPAPIHLLSDRYADLSLQENQENTLLAFTSLRDNAGPTSNEYHQGQGKCPCVAGSLSNLLNVRHRGFAQ